MPTTHEQPDYKLAMLAAAEASFAQAAIAMQPALRSLIDEDEDIHGPALNRIQTGLELLEEAMEIHEKYMKACK